MYMYVCMYVYIYIYTHVHRLHFRPLPRRPIEGEDVGFVSVLAGRHRDDDFASLIQE